ncbi:MAG: hypothetical protein HXX12_01940 [Geothrix sp.]|uniref:hypothetical protein n=1 Tax=Geothrix sp. TaxID=1962974 RepID=UPI0017B3EFFB|nr:hypothetical protein [Geothrix sp.]NWJ39715.1 hypothetical protein [Geothrix sp.]WIL22268.1 MAG: hypothetical protein QOZ81_001563 [Geothrix sp.]
MPLTMPFEPGDLVVVVLQSPRERIWGALLGLDAAGIAIRGLDLTPWEEVLSLVRTGESDQVALGTRFLPMHRVEAMYLDEASSGAPSLAVTFKNRTGQEARAFLVPTQSPTA